MVPDAKGVLKPAKSVKEILKIVPSLQKMADVSFYELENLLIVPVNRNNALYRKNGEKKINDNALAALALLVAESNPNEKDQIIALITQLLK